MNRPHFIVKTKGNTGGGYDAQSLNYGHAVVDGKHQHVVTFLCSGTVTTIPADQIAGIDFSFHPASQSGDFCGQCDQSIGHIGLLE
jgi:hypothetical protein